MKRRAALAIGLACATAPLTSASNAAAEESFVASPSVRPYRLEPILGLAPGSAAPRLTATKPLFDPLRPAAPKAIVSSEEKTLIIVAAAIVGVVLVVAVFAH